MLAVVKKPHIEMSLNGESPAELLAWIRRKFEVVVLSPRKGDSLPIDDTDFWRDMNRNRAGNLLAGARVKAEMTQAEVAEKAGIRQNMVSEYESGKRPLTRNMAKRFAEVLKIDLVRLIEKAE